MRPAEHHFSGSWHRGILAAGMAAPAFPAAQEVPSTEERNPGNQEVLADSLTLVLAPKAPLASPTITRPSSLLQRDTDHVSSQPCRQKLITGLPGLLNSSQPAEFNAQSCLFSQGRPFWSPALVARA